MAYPIQLMSVESSLRLAQWQSNNLNGLQPRKFALALKLLEETLELCYASGAVVDDVRNVVNAEEAKALGRREIDGVFKIADVRGEMGDVGVCYAAIAHFTDINPVEVIDSGLERINSRVWTPDEFGILRRPR